MVSSRRSDLKKSVSGKEWRELEARVPWEQRGATVPTGLERAVSIQA